MRGEAVSIDRISKTYGSVSAVNDVSLEVRAGEFLSLLGPSGSGKSTLLMMIAGFEHPNTGSITVAGQDITYTAPNKRDVGMVFQKYALFPHMTVAQNIGFPLKMRKQSRDEIKRRVNDALALVRLEAYGHRMPAQLSGGQQQRVAVARALVFEPPVLLMDEPLGALDKKLREQMQIEIKSLQKRLGVTVIYVTHDQEEALTMSDRIAVMNAGSLAQIGTPVDLYQKPESPFVAEFIGKMNFLEAEILGHDTNSPCIKFSACSTVDLPKSLNGNAAHFVKNKRTQVAIRPENISILAAGSGGSQAIPGTIEAAIFVGAYKVLLVRLEGFDREPLHVQIPIDQNVADYDGGDEIDVVIDSQAIHLFPVSRI